MRNLWKARWQYSCHRLSIKRLFCTQFIKKKQKHSKWKCRFICYFLFWFLSNAYYIYTHWLWNKSKQGTTQSGTLHVKHWIFDRLLRVFVLHIRQRRQQFSCSCWWIPTLLKSMSSTPPTSFYLFVESFGRFAEYCGCLSRLLTVKSDYTAHALCVLKYSWWRQKSPFQTIFLCSIAKSLIYFWVEGSGQKCDEFSVLPHYKRHVDLVRHRNSPLAKFFFWLLGMYFFLVCFTTRGRSALLLLTVAVAYIPLLYKYCSMSYDAKNYRRFRVHGILHLPASVSDWSSRFPV